VRTFKGRIEKSRQLAVGGRQSTVSD